VGCDFFLDPGGHTEENWKILKLLYARLGTETLGFVLIALLLILMEIEKRLRK